MWAAMFLAFCCALQVCQGILLDSTPAVAMEREPKRDMGADHGPQHQVYRGQLRGSQAEVKLVGRHIQYLGNSYGSGIGDRIGVLSWLVDLATFNNATMHLEGGPMGARSYLTSKHSRRVNANWSHYFNVEAGCGKNPFNEVRPFEGCVNISDPYFNFSNQLFSGNVGCVNIMLRRYAYKNHKFSLDDKKRCNIWKGGLAPSVYKQSRQLLQANGSNTTIPRFGAYHIRRCDRMNSNAACTNPAFVASVINNITTVKDWVIFYYAEPGYKLHLKKLLWQCNPCNRIISFEDELPLNPFQDGDNYYTFLVANDLLSLAAVRVESTYCSHGIGSIKTQQVASMVGQGQDEEAEGSSEDVLFGECSPWEGIRSLVNTE